MPRRTEEQIRSEHQIVHEDPAASGPGRIFCSCEWWSPVAPSEARMGLLERHIDHEVNAEEWFWGDQEKARQRYYEIERYPAGALDPRVDLRVQA